MKNYLFISAILAASFLGAVEVDGIAARVGVKPIYKTEILSELQMAPQGMRYEQMRSRMIERLLILNAATQAKLHLQDWAVQNRIDEIIKSTFAGDRNKLMAYLTQSGLSYAKWSERIKENMIISAMRWQTIDRNINPSPAQMRNEYLKNPQHYRSPRRVTVSVILLSPDKASLMGEVSQALKNQPFADVARKYSSDSRSSLGGKWEDVVPEEVFKTEVCDEISRMPKGTLSKWLEIEGWCFLIRLDDVKPPKDNTFEEAYDEIDRRVRSELSEKLFKEWIDRLKRDTYIKVY
ncbi:MAG: peptidylprolyl isomerase [Kiritimatiellae bacterium]|nr:peptidylprolyl isomerase [Kiritimatiellia bacterium]